jgi:two-component system chemotaxis response regulator CheB
MGRPELVVIGTSAGGLRALQFVAKALSPSFPACVVAVMHVSAESTLAAILSRNAAISVKLAENGDPIRPGAFYVAPPDHHLLVRDGAVELTRGPRENRARPAIDPLFRSAALAYGDRVIGVILTGFLDDGAAGLLAIRRAGGVAVVQNPDDAEAPSMPATALARVAVDYCVPLAELPALLELLTGDDWLAHARRSAPEPALLVEQVDGMGHGFTAAMALAGQEQVVEHSLWIAARALEERAALLAAMAADERAAHREDKAREFTYRELKSRQGAARVRALLSHPDYGPGPPRVPGLKE